MLPQKNGGSQFLDSAKVQLRALTIICKKTPILFTNNGGTITHLHFFLLFVEIYYYLLFAIIIILFIYYQSYLFT